MLSLHIGYAKTGTTFLQEHLFPKLGINYLGRNYLNGAPCDDKELEWIYELALAPEWRRPESFSFADSLAGAVVSSEAFIRPYHTHRTLKRIKELADHIGDVRILNPIRNHVDPVLSR